MDALARLLKLSGSEKAERGLAHAPAEIAQQPATWQSTFGRFQEQQKEIREFLSAAGLSEADFGSRPAVVLIGAGTSDYIGQSLTHLLRRMWQSEVTAIPSTDLLTHAEELLLPGRRYLWISFSRSGDSPESVAVLEWAVKTRPDIQHLIVCCNTKGRMLQQSRGRSQMLGVCLDDAVNDRGLAMTSSFSNMVIFGQCLAHVDDLGRYEEILTQLIRAGQSFLPIAADRAAELAELRFDKACFIGSGPLRAVARESALKLLEMTAGRTLTMSESVLGLRHGPMAALDGETMLVCFLSSSPRVQKFELDLLEEIGGKRLVQSRVVVAANSESRRSGLAEHWLSPASPLEVTDDYRAPVDVMLGQLLGLFFSLRWKLRPDSPSPSGAISRVVQNVKIHA
jgi:tagatose-6-phosphate ketose/aldose isomerase